ncbi:MAG: glycosyltransferase family 39 protein [Chloroflexota bacterium]
MEFAPIGIVVAIAAALRINDLGFRSLWLDEVATAQVVRLRDLAAVVDYVTRDPSATPGMYVLTWSLRWLGNDELAIRLPYALAGLLTVVALFALARRLYGTATGLVAAALFAILPFAIFYSQEARSYALLMLLGALLMLAAYRAVTRGHALDWVVLAAIGTLNLYVAYLAISVVAAAFAYVGLILAGNLAMTWRATGLRTALADTVRPAAWAALALIFVAVAYLPWFGHLATFLGRPDQGFGRAAAGHRATFEEANALLQQLDLQGLLLWLLVVGITRTMIDLLRGQWKASLVPLTWFGIPLLGFALGTGGGIVTIWPRYFGALYPAAILLCAIGVEGLARAAGSLVRAGRAAMVRHRGRGARIGSSPARSRAPVAVQSVAMIALVCVVAADALPADAAAYRRPKGSDYRGAVDAMLETGGDRPLVLVVGSDPDWTVSGLEYYSWVRDSRVTVIDALKVSATYLDTIERATTVWGAGLTATDVTDPTTAGLTSALYSDVLLVQPGGRLPPMNQALAVLQWAASFEEEITATVQLIGVLQGHVAAGPELLPSPIVSEAEGATAPLDRWILQPGASLSEDGSAFVLDPDGRSINVYLVTLGLQPGGQYLISFSCRAAELSGSVNVFVVAEGPIGGTTFPDGSGHACAGLDDPKVEVFAFTVPESSTSTVIWLRATGDGTARFESVSLRSLQ